MGLLLALAAFFVNVLIFVRPSADRLVVWISLALAALALVFLFTGITRAFRKGRGKVLSSITSLVTLLVCGLTIYAFIHSRQVPISTKAPQVGQRAPDFTLADSTGKQVSLVQILVAPMPNGASPKATLLVFYRGYW